MAARCLRARLSPVCYLQIAMLSKLLAARLVEPPIAVKLKTLRLIMVLTSKGQSWPVRR